MLKFVLSILFLISSLTAVQQEEQLQISMRRNFGFSSGTGRIQGTFTIRTSGPQDLTEVVFYLDDQVLGEITEPPFELRFVTDDYPLGVHQIWAAGFTESGLELQSNVIQREFVSAGQG